MRLTFIITGLSTGGAETMLFKLLKNIDRGRFEPSVVSLTTKGEIGPLIEALNIPVYALGMKPGFFSLIKLPHLVQYLRELKPDVVHTWMYHADLLGGLAARLAGVRVLIWCLRNSDLPRDRSKCSTILVMKLCAKLSAWLPHGVVSCSERAGSLHVEAGYCPNKITIIPNGFDLGRFMPNSSARASVRTELGLPLDVPMVGMVARDDPQKNHAGFISAAVQVIQEVPTAQFLLAGSGIDNQNPRLMRAIADSNFEDRFHLLGKRDDIPILMAALDVFASSSWGEAFPNVLGEAMACGVPCVVTDVGESAEIVGDTGRVVEPGDMEGLARQIIGLLSQPEVRSGLGRGARLRIQEFYEICDVSRQYEHYYHQLVRQT